MAEMRAVIFIPRFENSAVSLLEYAVTFILTERR
jgi:hypothetical protein